MKHLSTLCLLFFCFAQASLAHQTVSIDEEITPSAITTASVYNKKIAVELGLSPAMLSVGAYKPLNNKSVVGITSSYGFVFPALAANISPNYKYYFNEYIRKNQSGYKGSFFVTTGLNFFALKDLHAGSDNKFNFISFFNAGIGYEINYRNIFFRPTLSLGIPFNTFPNDSYIETLLGASFASSMQSTIAVYYRF